MWKPLQSGYNTFYGRAGEMGLPNIATQTTWQRPFDETEPMHTLVIERRDELFGIVHFLHRRSTT